MQAQTFLQLQTKLRCVSHCVPPEELPEGRHDSKAIAGGIWQGLPVGKIDEKRVLLQLVCLAESFLAGLQCL